jgi:5S rRNA maturation endonuclease (ribonuclease M5)
VLKKIMIVIGIIIVWEGRDSIVPVSESVITYVIATGSSLLQSV